uniref:Uncharacterized protein n=1 Tax=Anas zonorhyncha TaxID=75864 RepID=A0A8B9UB05_9AVES
MVLARPRGWSRGEGTSGAACLGRGPASGRGRCVGGWQPQQGADAFPPPSQVRPRHHAPAVPEGSGQRGGGLHPSPVSPHRLLWPRSKSFDYLYGVGESLLRNFPVQATSHEHHRGHEHHRSCEHHRGCEHHR